jgi:hypothetical protein
MEGDDYDINGPSIAPDSAVEVAGSAEESGVQSYIDFEELLHSIIGHGEMEDDEQVAGDCDGADEDFVEKQELSLPDQVEGDEEEELLDNFGAPIEGAKDKGKEKDVDFSLDDGMEDILGSVDKGGFYQFVSGDADDDNGIRTLAPDNLLNLEYQDEEEPASNHVDDGDQGSSTNILNRSFKEDIQMYNDAALFAE